jgi:hypothetical protein
LIDLQVTICYGSGQIEADGSAIIRQDLPPQATTKVGFKLLLPLRNEKERSVEQCKKRLRLSSPTVFSGDSSEK